MQKTVTYKLRTSQKIYYFIKSAIDFVIAFFALIVLSPLFLIVAVAIKLDSKGPVFFFQERIGKDGKIFKLIKFRSMTVEANHAVASCEYSNVNSYITKTGVFIRKYSIDELPQLFNILKFDMSLIGYRPSLPCEDVLNCARESYNMYQIKPGMSGWAQVNGRDILGAQPKRKAEFDAYYLEHFSPWLDIKIFFMTITKLFQTDSIKEGPLNDVSKDEE